MNFRSGNRLNSQPWSWTLWWIKLLVHGTWCSSFEFVLLCTFNDFFCNVVLQCTCIFILLEKSLEANIDENETRSSSFQMQIDKSQYSRWIFLQIIILYIQKRIAQKLLLSLRFYENLLWKWKIILRYIDTRTLHLN